MITRPLVPKVSAPRSTDASSANDEVFPDPRLPASPPTTKVPMFFFDSVSVMKHGGFLPHHFSSPGLSFDGNSSTLMEALILIPSDTQVVLLPSHAM